MFKGDFRIFFADLDHRVAPNLRSFQHIGFIHADKVFAAAHSGFKGNVGNSFHFGNGVAHCVKAFFGTGKSAVRTNAFASGLTKVNVTGQFSNQKKIQAGDKFRLQRGSCSQFRIANGRAKIHEKS